MKDQDKRRFWFCHEKTPVCHQELKITEVVREATKDEIGQKPQINPYYPTQEEKKGGGGNLHPDGTTHATVVLPQEEKTTRESWEKEFEVLPEHRQVQIDWIKDLLSSERQRMVEMIVSWDFSENGACVLISEKKNGVVTVIHESRLTNGAINLSLLTDKDELSPVCLKKALGKNAERTV